MSRRGQLILSGALLLGGCVYHVQEHADQLVCDLAARPLDLAPAVEDNRSKQAPEKLPGPNPVKESSRDKPKSPTDPTLDAKTATLLQPEREQVNKSRLQIPAGIPGAEARKIEVPMSPAQREKEIRKLFPDLPPLPQEPVALPGPDGRPYTLADLQRIAAENSPQLRQAAADVEAARGAVIQAGAYPNPTMGYVANASNDGSTPTAQGVLLQQTVKTFGKLKLQSAAAEMDLANAELALKKARNDLATQVRSGYFNLLVAREAVRVQRALARFTDDVYLIQANLSAGAGTAAPYEPAALRAQANTSRLAYKQAIQAYVYSWKQLVTAIGMRQLPLSEVAGRVDRAIPEFDYDVVLAHVLRHHTDMLAARNGMDKARYNLKSAQVAPYPDVTVQMTVQKEFALEPFQWVPTAQVTVPIPIFDTNRGNRIAAEAGLMRAGEEPHRVEMNLTNSLASAYQTYRSNLEALEYYRRYILPDQVRTYRGVFERRDIDPSILFADLVTAQQSLTQSVNTYLTVLGQLWTSVVNVADLLQTDDLFQLGHPLCLPGLPELDDLPSWPCTHPCAAHGPGIAPASPALAATRSEGKTLAVTRDGGAGDKKQ